MGVDMKTSPKEVYIPVSLFLLTIAAGTSCGFSCGFVVALLIAAFKTQCQ